LQPAIRRVVRVRTQMSREGRGMLTVLHGGHPANPLIGQKRADECHPSEQVRLAGDPGMGHPDLEARGWAVVEKLLVALAEAFAVVVDGGRRDGRIAVAGVVGEGRRAAGGDVAAGGFKAVVDALVVNLDGGWRWAVDDRLRMRAAGEQRGGGEKDDGERFLHGESPMRRVSAHVWIDTRNISTLSGWNFGDVGCGAGS